MKQVKLLQECAWTRRSAATRNTFASGPITPKVSTAAATNSCVAIRSSALRIWWHEVASWRVGVLVYLGSLAL